MNTPNNHIAMKTSDNRKEASRPSDQEGKKEQEECQNCKSIEYNPNEAPLSTEVMAFYDIVRDEVTHCSIAGGAVLAEKIYQDRKCSSCCSSRRWKIQQHRNNTDIDLFVPQHPKLVEEFYVNPNHTEKYYYGRIDPGADVGLTREQLDRLTA